MTIYVSSIKLKGSKIGEQNPIPFFRDKDHDKPFKDGGLLPEERKGFGYETGFRVLPYKMQDTYKRAEGIIELKTVVLENKNLKAEFLPEYGGRLYSLFDKKNKRELLYVNPVFQPANLAIRNAWFSGGIEWNLGQFGHTFYTCSPVFFAKCHDLRGSEFLRMYEYERCRGLFLQIDFHLPDDSEVLFAHVSIVNSNDKSTPVYWWTNIAVEENRNVRVFSGTQDVIYIKPESLKDQQSVHSFAHGEIPYLASLNGADASYPGNLPYSNEYFFQNPYDYDSTFEAAAYDDGTAFFERSTPRLRYRKMFCWGNQRGGEHWQEFLTEPGTSRYLEIQAGISPTQVHGMDMGPRERWSFTQVFGGLNIDSLRISGEWTSSRDYIHSVVDSKLSVSELTSLDTEFEHCVNIVPYEILHSGSGWGALESKRDKSIIPKGMIFEDSTLKEEQKPWLELLEHGKIPELGADELPASWIVDYRWMDILGKSLNDSANINATSLLYYGVMLYENGSFDEGIDTLKRSLKLLPTAICAASLAEAMILEQRVHEACDYMDYALKLGGANQSKAFVVEAIKTYNAAKEYDKSWKLYQNLSVRYRNEDRIILEVSNAAFELQKWDFLDWAFKQNYPGIREGESKITELWFRKQAIDEASRLGIKNYEDILDEIMESLVPPYNIDFGMGISNKTK